MATDMYEMNNHYTYLSKTPIHEIDVDIIFQFHRIKLFTAGSLCITHLEWSSSVIRNKYKSFILSGTLAVNSRY